MGVVEGRGIVLLPMEWVLSVRQDMTQTRVLPLVTHHVRDTYFR